MTKWIELYHRTKGVIFRVMEEPNSPSRRWYHAFMILLVMISIGLLVLEVQSAKNPPLAHLYANLGEGLTFLFLIEYLLRWWIIPESPEKSSSAARERIATY